MWSASIITELDGSVCSIAWGDVRHRVPVDSKDSLYMVAKGEGASSVFSLDTYKDVVKNDNCK